MTIIIRGSDLRALYSWRLNLQVAEAANESRTAINDFINRTLTSELMKNIAKII